MLLNMLGLFSVCVCLFFTQILFFLQSSEKKPQLPHLRIAQVLGVMLSSSGPWSDVKLLSIFLIVPYHFGIMNCNFLSLTLVLVDRIHSRTWNCTLLKFTSISHSVPLINGDLLPYVIKVFLEKPNPFPTDYLKAIKQ